MFKWLLAQVSVREVSKCIKCSDYAGQPAVPGSSLMVTHRGLFLNLACRITGEIKVTFPSGAFGCLKSKAIMVKGLHLYSVYLLVLVYQMYT